MPQLEVKWCPRTGFEPSTVTVQRCCSTGLSYKGIDC